LNVGRIIAWFSLTALAAMGAVGADLPGSPARVAAPPVINAQPIDRTAEEGDYIWQDHSVIGGTPMTFRWFRLAIGSVPVGAGKGETSAG
jgi:hypothetical protein